MPRRPPFTRRWLTALTWPVGIALTSWDYMWRSTPMHRRELLDSDIEPHLPPALPDTVDHQQVQGTQAGHGPLFHRRYSTGIRDTELTARELLERLTSDLNEAAPTTFARFEKVLGETGRMSPGDEYVVRMPGPWDGPVRVIETAPRSFRLATLEGHLEAGQIEFRARDGDPLRFEIESWARSGDRLSNLMYHRLRMAKEVQAHMWISFLEGAVALAGGRMDGGVTIETRRVEERA
ncbi:MAG: DUF1990 domain-containing protein [Actinomycetota bacterium]|nr:DUF1990 domain-containing protein [Actinomycetota bacterium]